MTKARILSSREIVIIYLQLMLIVLHRTVLFYDGVISEILTDLFSYLAAISEEVYTFHKKTLS